MNDLIIIIGIVLIVAYLSYINNILEKILRAIKK